MAMTWDQMYTTIRSNFPQNSWSRFDTAPAVNRTLIAANFIKGDADGDGHVQFSDFLILSSNFGMPGQYTDRDLDSDGDLQFSDFLRGIP